MPNPRPLTQEQFDLLPLGPDWPITEVPRENWSKIPGLVRPDDTIAVMASGCVSNPGILNGINAVAGLDVLAYESTPLGDEPPGNAYHFVVQKINDDRFPYLIHGPFRSETIVPHWFDAPDLVRYWAE